MNQLRLALVQMNSWVGDLDRNVQKILEFIARARSLGAEIVAFPELAITGYPPEDLLLKKSFVQANLKALQSIVPVTSGVTVVVGFVDAQEEIYNAAAVIHDGRVAGVHHKVFLPNYGVFDEDRYFKAGSTYQVFQRGGGTFGVGICEDIWYPEGPALYQSLLGNADLILNINASPFHAGKWKMRERMLSTRAADHSTVVAYLNMVGGQDELIFDGHSLVILPSGEVMVRGKICEEEILLADLTLDGLAHARQQDPKRKKAREFLKSQGIKVERVALPPASSSQRSGDSSPEVAGAQSPAQAERVVRAVQVAQAAGPSVQPPPDTCEEIYKALVLGVRDYVNKNAFKEVVIGLSGGIDSSLTAVIAVDALGKERVKGIFLPSRYSSRESGEDAAAIARNLGIAFLEISIEEVFSTYLQTLRPVFAGKAEDVTEENIQARIRGNLLMALSNKFGWLVLTTGNKSEMACGYATLYGDMAGGFSVIKDVPKTLVYKLAKYRNGIREVIPERILEKPPTAELRHGQNDQDTLPPYEILDPILQHYVEEDLSLEEIAALGFDEEVVARVIAMVDRNEYKRRQAPPGIKITPKAFGKDRRLPITNLYRERKKGSAGKDATLGKWRRPHR